ncbi:MAG: hypothetical protein CMI90_04850 [Pelagibacteraceae bacterium]|nr:hypothetical protein [Pelagibacteraceae bacterium]|tara:strand:+ start:409 stop:663 length:255 start_codon:yes stop_codon:yes gene_type:complete
MNLEEIKKTIIEIKEIELKKIIDNSSKHVNHSALEHTRVKLTHLELWVVNKLNLSRIEIHRIIYDKLSNYFLKGLHSVEIKIFK